MNSLARIKLDKENHQKLLDALEDLLNYDIKTAEKLVNKYLTIKKSWFFKEVQYPKHFDLVLREIDPHSLTCFSEHDLKGKLWFNYRYRILNSLNELLKVSNEVYLDVETLKHFNYLVETFEVNVNV